MRITDPQWPAVREASRRILRLQQIRIMLPHKFHSLTKKIIIQLGESQPSRTTFPILMESNKISIEMENDEDEVFTGSCVTRGGQVVNERVNGLLNPAPAN